MKQAQKKILYLTSCWPGDRAFGGQLRTLHIGRALQRLGDVTVSVVSSDPVNAAAMDRTAREFTVEPPVSVEVCRSTGVVSRLRCLLDTRYLNIHGCNVEPSDRSRLLRRFSDFDLLWVSNSRTANILNQWRWPHSILDIDDLPSTYQGTVWKNGGNLADKLKAGIQVMMLKRRELLLKQRFSALAVCSEGDRRYLGGGERIHVIPNGFERPRQEPRRNLASPPRIGFIGLFSYQPNLEAVRWFLQSCWERIKAEVPQARLRLVGKDTDGPLKPIGANIDALGWLENPADEIATWSAMIIPVRHGAGTRVKVADALSRKCPVVSTRLGAYGYEVEHGRELFLADEPAQFAAACVSLMKEPAVGRAMAERAFSAFLKHWTWEAIAPKVWAAAEDGMRHGLRHPRSGS